MSRRLEHVVTNRLGDIDTQIATLWASYRIPSSSSAVLIEIDKLLDERHLLLKGPEMLHPDDVATLGEYGAADLGTAA